MPCGNLHKEQETNLNIQKIEVYETHEHPDFKITIRNIFKTEKILTLIVFFSPSGVKFALPYIKEISNKNIKVKNLILKLLR